MRFHWLLLATAPWLAGCYATWDVHPRELRQLDGFREGTRDKRTLHDIHGEAVEVDERTTYRMYPYEDPAPDVNAKLAAVQVDGPKLTIETGGDHRVLVLDMPRYTRMRVDAFSKGQTITAAVLGSVALAGALAATPFLVWVATNDHCPSTGPCPR